MDDDIRVQGRHIVRIRRETDSFMFCPSEMDEGFPPFVSATKGLDPRSSDVDPLSMVEADLVFQRRREIADALGVDVEIIEEDALIEADSSSSLVEDLIHDALREALSESYPTRFSAHDAWISAAAGIFKAIGVPVHEGSANGYCQGDVFTALMIATPEWQRRVLGRKAPIDREDEPDAYALIEADLAAAFESLAAWAFGDVYFWEIYEAPLAREPADGSVDESAHEIESDDLDDLEPIAEGGPVFDRDVPSAQSLVQVEINQALEAMRERDTPVRPSPIVCAS